MVGTATGFPKCSNPACDADKNATQQQHQACGGGAGGGGGGGAGTCDIAEKCIAACAAYGRVCPCTARAAGRAACQALQGLVQNSTIFAGEPNFVHFNCDDIVINHKLGEGGFSVVNACVLKTGTEAGQEFAIKHLKRQIMMDQYLFEHGAADLAVEARFLGALDHPHIVKLHGITAGSVESAVATGKEYGYFIVIDRLYDTLEHRIEKWHEEAEAMNSGLLFRFSQEHKEKRKRMLAERLQVAMEVADVMQYLHSLNIIYRDLKPDNIGFDKNGVIKLFDFGLAKELRPAEALPNGRYNLTGNTGSRRYMAPEIARDAPYDLSVDVYSFGILLWEMCAAEKPFYGYSSGKHMTQVVCGGERPKMDGAHVAHWPMNLQWLMKRCWSTDPKSRPTFDVIKQTLQDILDCKKDAAVPTVAAPPAGFAGMKPSAQPRAQTVAITSSTGVAGAALAVKPPQNRPLRSKTTNSDTNTTTTPTSSGHDLDSDDKLPSPRAAGPPSVFNLSWRRKSRSKSIQH